MYSLNDILSADVQVQVFPLRGGSATRCSLGTNHQMCSLVIQAHTGAVHSTVQLVSVHLDRGEEICQLHSDMEYQHSEATLLLRSLLVNVIIGASV